MKPISLHFPGTIKLQNLFVEFEIMPFVSLALGADMKSYPPIILHSKILGDNLIVCSFCSKVLKRIAYLLETLDVCRQA